MQHKGWSRSSQRVSRRPLAAARQAIRLTSEGQVQPAEAGISFLCRADTSDALRPASYISSCRIDPAPRRCQDGAGRTHSTGSDLRGCAYRPTYRSGLPGHPCLPLIGDAPSKQMLPSHAFYSGSQRQNSLDISVEFSKRSTLTAEQYLLLELIADKPLPAIVDIAQYTRILAAARLIDLTPAGKWRITSLGQAVLDRHEHWLH